MWYAIEAVICILLGGWGGYALGAKVKAKAEDELMRGRGYVKQGVDWIKARV